MGLQVRKYRWFDYKSLHFNSNILWSFLVAHTATKGFKEDQKSFGWQEFITVGGLKVNGLLTGDVIRVTVDLTIFAAPQTSLTSTTVCNSNITGGPGIVNTPALHMAPLPGKLNATGAQNQSGTAPGVPVPHTTVTTGISSAMRQTAGNGCAGTARLANSDVNRITNYVYSRIVGTWIRWAIAAVIIYGLYAFITR